MKKLKGIKKALLIALIVVISPFVLFFARYGFYLLFVPISRSPDDVHSYVLRKIPIGTDWDDALQTMDKMKWEVENSSTEYGLVVSEKAVRVDFAYEMYMDNPKYEPIGEQCMRVYLGDFRIVFDTAVLAYLAFDENGKLIEVFIIQEVDTL